MVEFDQAIRALDCGDLKRAEVLLNAVLEDDPKSVDGWLYLGITQMGQHKRAEADISFVRLLELEPNQYDGLVWRAEIAREQGNLAQASDLVTQAIKSDGSRADGYTILGAIRLREGHLQEAVRNLEIGCRKAPDLDRNHHYLGLAYGQLHDSQLAEYHLRKAITLAKRNPQNYLALSGLFSRYGLAVKALDTLKEGLSMCPTSALLHTQAAANFTLIKNEVAAEAHHRRAAGISPEASASYAIWLIDQGRFDEAETLFLDLIRIRSDLGIAYYGLFQCRKRGTTDDGILAEMRRICENHEVAPVSRMYAAYGLGMAYEQLGNPYDALSSYKEANRLAFEINSPQAPFDLEKIRSESECVQSRSIAFRSIGARSNCSQSPIFIIGMIRSGTTLLDQIVSSHPEVRSVGESRYWIEKALWLSYLDEKTALGKLEETGKQFLDYVGQLLGTGTRFTDKMPLNFAYLGIIAEALPNAKFIHIRRHPVDTCLSIYSTYFGSGSQFVYNRANTVAYYREYLDSMNFWRGFMPSDRLLEIDYESLIDQKEATVRDVIQFCELPWNEACLNHEQNTSAINTPSRWQARQPVYRSSMGKWRKYEPWLEEFAELLSASPSNDSII